MKTENNKKLFDFTIMHGLRAVAVLDEVIGVRNLLIAVHCKKNS